MPRKGSSAAGCCESGLAAEYLGWNGIFQTFEFANAGFADLFRQANADKVVG